MTGPKVVRNVYCTDPEDRVIETRCPSCEHCWVFVASRWPAKRGRCVFGGPYGGFMRERDHGEEPVTSSPPPIHPDQE